jgi:hypothetical protein
MQGIISNTLDHVIADAGYRGHNASPKYQFEVYPLVRTATSRRTTAWAAIILSIQAAMPSTPCSPPSDTTSASCSGG